MEEDKEINERIEKCERSKYEHTKETTKTNRHNCTANRRISKSNKNKREGIQRITTGFTYR